MHHDDHNIHFEYFNLHRPILKENLPCWRRRKPLLWTGLSCWKWRCLMERCQRHGQRVTSPSGAQEGLWAMWPLELTVLPPIRVRIFCATILDRWISNIHLIFISGLGFAYVPSVFSYTGSTDLDVEVMGERWKTRVLSGPPVSTASNRHRSKKGCAQSSAK